MDAKKEQAIRHVNLEYLYEANAHLIDAFFHLKDEGVDKVGDIEVLQELSELSGSLRILRLKLRKVYDREND